MLHKQLALVCLSKRLTPTELSQTAAALQKQATRDLGPIWNIQATVDYFPDLKSIPLGYWPIIISENIHEQGAAGFHTDKHHQPFSLVQLGDSWQLTCSHEMCEMLVDPYGNKLAYAGSKDPEQGKVKYLVEVCDPCEDASFAYSVNGILMSDFYTPNFFDPQKVPGVRYSYTGSITEPLEIKKNGYISWKDPITKQWYQETYFGSKPVINVLKGMKDFGGSLRSQVDRLTNNPNHSEAFKTAAKKHAPLQTRIFKSSSSMSNNLEETIAPFVSKLSAAIVGETAILDVTFNLGVGELTAKLFRMDGSKESNSLGSSGGTIHFNNVSSGDSINIEGTCAGTASVSLNLSSDPVPLKEYSKNFNDSFRII